LVVTHKGTQAFEFKITDKATTISGEEFSNARKK
jgi:hypothetical protein